MPEEYELRSDAVEPRTPLPLRRDQSEEEVGSGRVLSDETQRIGHQITRRIELSYDLEIAPPGEFTGWWDSSPLSAAVQRKSLMRRSLSSRDQCLDSKPPPSFQDLRLTFIPNNITARTSPSITDAVTNFAQPKGFEFPWSEAFKHPDEPETDSPSVEIESKDVEAPKIRQDLKNTVEARSSQKHLERLIIPTRPQPTKSPALFLFPSISTEDTRRVLSNRSLYFQRSLMGVFVLAINLGCLTAALTSQRHLWVLIVLLFVKAKDVLSTLMQMLWILPRAIMQLSAKQPDLSSKWILACITAYAETEEQIMKTIDSVIDHHAQPHKMILVVILDGRPQDVLSRFSKVSMMIRRPYQTWRCAHNEVNVYAGCTRSLPIILIEKVGNAGKKDSLILCHDLFNHMRSDAPDSTKALRLEIWTRLLPAIIDRDFPMRFDYLFFTDADSCIHAETLNRLAAALTADPRSIAACGLVLAQSIPGQEWSIFHLYQQFQYTFGQFIRRRAEGLWGRVTCLPGCVTMIKNRPEMAGAIQMYAKPITDRSIFQHQVHYLGTDRRLTYCMLQQSKSLRTLFVPQALSETVAPEDFFHYMSQRRRWGSNAYFNDIFYAIGSKSWLITRLWAVIDIVRQTMVFYRLANTILFIYGLSRHFVLLELIPYLVVTQTPTIWFLVVIMVREPVLRKQAHKLVAGWLINKMISPFFSIIVFSRILLNLGSAVWGRTGAKLSDLRITGASVFPTIQPFSPPKTWSPTRISELVRVTIWQRTKKPKPKMKPPVSFDIDITSALGSATSIATCPATRATSFPSPTSPPIAYIPSNGADRVTARKYRTIRLVTPEQE